MPEPQSKRSPRRGQALVLFVLVLTALIGLTGLVIDGSSTYVQRRGMQNAADLAAMAAGYAYVNGTDMTAAAKAVTQANGYADGTNHTTVVVTTTPLNSNTAEQITVSITAPHQNWFSGIFGLSSWNVGTTATVLAGIPNAVAGGALPLIFNADLCSPQGNCNANKGGSYNEPPSGNQSIPVDAASSGYFEFNWTIFCLANGNPCNADSKGVAELINGTSPTTAVTITIGDKIGPLNAGSHTALFGDLARLVPGCYPVAMVGSNGNLEGFATFCLTGSQGGSIKQITGSFPSGVTGSNLTITPGGGTPQFFGSWAIALVN